MYISLRLETKKEEEDEEKLDPSELWIARVKNRVK